MQNKILEISRENSLKAYILLCIGAIAVAFMPSTARLAYLDGSNVETVIVIRSLLGAVLLGGFLIYKGKGMVIPRGCILPAIVASLSAAAMNYTFYSAIQYMDIGLATLILFVHPLLIAYYFHFTGKTHLTQFRLFWGLAAFAGIAQALTVDMTNISMTGLLLSMGAALFATIMVVTMLRVSAETGGVATNFHLSFWTMLIFLVVIATTSGQFKAPGTAVGWLSCIGNGIAFVTAYLTFLLAAALIGGARTAMLSFMEPIAAILLAAAMFDEQMLLIQWLGVALVALGICAMEAPTGMWRKLFSTRYQDI